MPSPDAAPAIAALHRRLLRRATIAWAVVAANMIALIVVVYESTYDTTAARERLAVALGGNAGLTAILGAPRGLDTVGGFLVWRIGAVLSTILAVWTVLTVTRQLRGEEDVGRWDRLLAGRITAASATRVVLFVIGQSLAAVFVGALLAQLVLGLFSDLAVRGAVVYSVALVAPAFALGAVAAVAAQLAPTRRSAAAAAGGALGLLFLLRVVADSSSALSSLRWLTPLGWTQELRAYTGDRLWPLALLVAWIGALGVLAVSLARRRDSGAAVLRARDTGSPTGSLLSSSDALAIRLLRGTTLAWMVGAGTWMTVMTLLATSVTEVSEDVFPDPVRDLFGGELTVQAHLGFAVFQLMAVLITVAAGSQVAAAREEEASGRLDTVLSRPVGRRRWLAGRLAIAVGEVTVIAAFVGVLVWLAVTAQGLEVSTREVVAGVANGVPLALLFLGAGVLVLGVAPRLASGAVHALLAITFLLQLLGDVLDAPGWLVGLSPFHHLRLVPLEAARVLPAIVMIAAGAALAAAGVAAFARRDLASA